jgi:hypothetical protein
MKLITKCNITQNSAKDGAGIFEGPNNPINNFITLIKSNVTNNKATVTNGGGIYNRGTVLVDELKCVSGNSPNNVSGNPLQRWAAYNNMTNKYYTTIQAAINDATSNATLILDSGTFYENLNINKNINLIGTDNSTINGSGNGRCIIIPKAAIVSLTELIITNGQAVNGWDDGGSPRINGDYGGAIYNMGTLTLTNTLILNNKAGNGGDADGSGYGGTGGSGGGIYNTGTLTIIDSIIKNNQAGNGGTGASNNVRHGNGGIGGNGALNITGSIIEDNQAGNGGSGTHNMYGGNGGSGGAIYNTGNFTLTNTTLSNNKAGNGGNGHWGYYSESGYLGGFGGFGGAIYNTGNLDIKITNFLNNTAGNGGDGGLGWHGETAGGGGPGGDGGAIYNKGYLTLTNSTFTSNIAGNGGNGGYSTNKVNGGRAGDAGSGGAVSSTKNFTIDDSNFISDKAGKLGTPGVLGNEGGTGGYGGAIQQSGDLNIENCNFTNNTALVGGALSSNNGIVNVIKSNFTNNKAQYSLHYDENGYPDKLYGGVGGAFYKIDANVLNLINCIFNNNTAIYGGGIYYNSNGTLNVLNSTFNYNNVTAVDQNGKPLQTVTYASPNTTANPLDGWKVADAVLGVGDKIVGGGDFDFSKTFKNLQSVVSVVHSIVGFLSGSNSEPVKPIYNNIMAIGGAIYSNAVNFNVTGSKFNNNTAGLGGAIVNNGDNKCNLKVTDSSFNNNSAGAGGAIYSNNLGSLNVTGSIFKSNIAGAGGAIFFGGKTTQQTGWAELTCEYSVFKGNSAYMGGMIYMEINGTSHSLINFNQIYGTNNYDIYNEYSTNKIDAKYNWWGSNNGASVYSFLNEWNVITTPYLFLTVTSNPIQPSKPKNIDYGGNTTITADFLHGSDYSITDPDKSKINPEDETVLNGIPITFTVENGDGTITPVSNTILNGVTTAIYTANGNTSGLLKIYANAEKIRNNTVSTLINVKQVPTTTNIDPVKGQTSGIVTINALVTNKNTGNPITTGNVSFTIGTTQLTGTLNSEGIASVNYTIPQWWRPGKYNIIDATYTGTGMYASSQKLADIIIVEENISVNKLEVASVTVENYYESHNILPSNLTINDQKNQMSQLISLLVTGTLDISKNNLNPLYVSGVKTAPNPSGSYTSGKLYEPEYLNIAQNIDNFINKNGRAPNYASTSLGTIPFDKLVYMYCKIINFYASHNRLPHYVSI